MAIVAAPDGSYYSNKTGKTYTREEIQAKLDEKKTQDSGSLFGSLFSGSTTTYEQTGALDNAINGYGRGVDVEGVEKSYNAHSYVETDTDRAARLREASNILGLDEIEGTNLMRGGLTDNDVMKSALALAKKKQEEPDDWEQFAADHPATVKYLEQQKNMSISYDDIKPLGRLEETANQVKTHLEMMELEEKIADLGRKYDAANMSYNDLSADQRVELNDLLTRRKELAGSIDTWSLGNVLGGLLAMKEDLPMALAVGLQTGLVGAGAGAVAGGVGAIPGALTGFGAGFRIGMGASMGYRMAGTQYAENMMRADANGQYMDANSLRQGAWGAGLGMTVLGSVGVGRLTNKLPVGQIYDKFLRTTSPSVLNNPAAREAAWKGYLSTLGVGLKEAAIQDVIFGGGTSALTYGANRYSEALSGLDYSNREDGTLVENIVNGMKQFAPMALGTGVGFSVGGRMMSNAMGKKGNNPPMPVADGLNKTMDAVNETKTAGRSPQATREAVNTIFGENASAQDVEINARGLVRLCQEADPENPNLAAEVAQKLGVDAETLNKAVETDDTVRVSVTDFVTEMKDSELRSEMLKEVKDVDGVTENERGEILTYQQQAFEKNLEFIKAAANAEYDHNDPAWVAAYEATQKAYPKLKPKDLEQLTNITYAGFKQMEERGILQLNGFETAEQAIRALDVRRVDAPSVNGINQAVASDVANTTVQELFQRAWHGTPYDFDRFDLGAIGTGEGAQAHGWGLYFAGNKSVSQEYRKRLSYDYTSFQVGDTVVNAKTRDGMENISPAESKAVYALYEEGGRLSDAIKSIKREREKYEDASTEYDKKSIAKCNEAIELLESGRVSVKKDKGRLFEVEIPDNDVLLDEQKVYSEQPEQVQGALKKLAEDLESGKIEVEDSLFVTSIRNAIRRDKATGSDFYHKLKLVMGSDRAASELLNQYGVKGIAYDGAQDGRCFVVFDDKAVEIINKFNQEAAKQGDVLASYMPQEQGRAIIELYKNANPSSLAHEMLHHWVFLHENAYRIGKMEGQVLQDFQKLAEFAGHELGTEWSEAEHEKLASAWETYLSEGKAPSLQLVSTFERFKNWMKRIYQALVRHSIPINDDVRGVFDRMLASDKELEMAQAFYESEPLFAGREMGAAELREYAAMVNASHKEAQREMDKRVMAEVNPAMKEIRDNVEANLREDIAGQMMMEPVYAARALFTAPLESADFKAAKETAIKNKIEERLDLLVKQSALGVEKKGMIVENAKQVSQEWFGGFSNNYDWYKEMFNRRGGKIPASWYRFIKAYKAGEKTLKQMPKTMREEYEYIANEQLTHGHKESVLGDIPEDIEFVNLKEDNPAMSWIVQNGGGIRLDRQSVYERFGKGALPERWLTDKNGYTIDEVADYVYDGQGSGDRLFQDLTTKPTFAKELNNRVRAGMAQFKDQEYGSLKDSAIKAVHNAKSLEAICLDLEIFEKNAAEFKSKQEQKTADAIAEGREKSKWENKIADEKQKGKEALENQKLADSMHFGRKMAEQKREVTERAAREQRWLDAAVMRGQVRAKMARAMAKEQLANTKVGEVLGWQKYAALAKKAGDEAVRLMSKGDYEGAIEAKNREITCHALAREAGKMDTEINKTLRYFNVIDKRGNKMKGIPHEFNVQIDNVLSKYGLLSREPLKPLEGDKSLQTFMEELHNDYELPNVAEWVVEGQKKPFEELTINEMRDLKDSVESIRKIGRSIDKALTGDRKKTISIRKQECLDALAKLPQWRAADNEAGKRQTSIMQKLLEIPSTYIAPDMGKMETFFQILDKGEEQGAFIRNLYNPIMEGLAKWDEMQIRMSNGWKKVLTDTGWTDGDLRKARSEMYTFDFMKNPLSKMEMIMMGANIGNEGNRDRLRYYFMTEEQRALAKKGALTDADISEIDGKMWQVLEKLSEKDWKLIQGMWDFLGTFVPEIRQHEVELSGVDPKLVEAMPSSVMTADGKMVQLRGGYFPIRYDSDKSIRAATLDEANALFKSGMVYATTTDHNYTKGRAMRVNRPLLLELNTLFDHLQEVGYDLAMRKPILDVHRVLRDDRIQAGIASVYGQNLVKSANEWLRHLASSQRESLTVAEKFLKATRTRMSIACVGFRMQAIPIDMVQNMMTSAWKHGATTTFNAITRSIISGHYIQQWRFVTEKSPFMRNKLNMVDQNLADLRGSIFEEHKFRDYLQRAAFAPDLAADLMVQIPIWEEFYSRYIKEGMSEKEAITRADSKVRQIATDTSKAGLSRIQRKSELMKLITPFYSYFNGYLNRLWKDYELSRLNWYDGKKADAARLFTRMMLIGFIIPGVYEGFMRGYVLDNDQEKNQQKRAKNKKAKAISSAVGYWTGPSPFIGKGISLAVGVGTGNKNADFSLSPVESAFEKTFGAAGMAYRYWDKGRLDDKDKRRIGRSVLDASAIVGGYPNRWNDIIFNALDGMNRHDWTIKDVFFRRQNQK